MYLRKKLTIFPDCNREKEKIPQFKFRDSVEHLLERFLVFKYSTAPVDLSELKTEYFESTTVRVLDSFSY